MVKRLLNGMMFGRQLRRISASRSFCTAMKNFCSATVSPKPLKSASPFDYTHAITRGIPKSFVDGSLKMDASGQIVLSQALQQFECYIDILKRCGLKVITLPAEECFPDCVFVEDSALVIGQKACLTRPGHPSRRGELVAIKGALEGLGFKPQELDDPDALLDGGDILFTGQEILVGMSSRSNKAAIKSLQHAFPEWPVIPIPISNSLHLKSVATLAQEGVLAVGGSEGGQEVAKHIQARGKGQYRFVQLSSDKAANVVYLNGQTVMKNESEIGSDYQKLKSGLTVPTIGTEFGEFYKADGCLSCCSLLLQVPS